MNRSLSLEALRYGHRQPLFAPLTLACRPGEIWAVLGANGRGKSTLLDTLTGVLRPLYQRLFASWVTPAFGPHAASLAYAVAFVALWWWLMWGMQRKGIRISI